MDHALLKDEACVKELFAAPDVAAALKVCETHGHPISVDELMRLGEHLEEGELDDAALDQVAGGKRYLSWRDRC